MPALKQRFFYHQLFTLGLLSSLTIGLLNTQTVQASSLELTFIGQSTFPTNTFYQGTQVGGLSGITYDPVANNFYTISDDRSQTNPARLALLSFVGLSCLCI